MEMSASFAVHLFSDKYEERTSSVGASVQRSILFSPVPCINTTTGIKMKAHKTE